MKHFTLSQSIHHTASKQLDLPYHRPAPALKTSSLKRVLCDLGEVQPDPGFKKSLTKKENIYNNNKNYGTYADVHFSPPSHSSYSGRVIKHDFISYIEAFVHLDVCAQAHLTFFIADSRIPCVLWTVWLSS